MSTVKEKSQGRQDQPSGAGSALQPPEGPPNIVIKVGGKYHPDMRVWKDAPRFRRQSDDE